MLALEHEHTLVTHYSVISQINYWLVIISLVNYDDDDDDDVFLHFLQTICHNCYSGVVVTET